MTRSRVSKALGVVIAAALVSLQGCTPCLGVVACSESPHAAVDGRLLVAETGGPVGQATVTLIAHHAAQADSTIGVTDGSGLFQLTVASPGGSISKMSLRVRPIGFPGYTVDSLPCVSVRVRGDACVLPPIVQAPWAPIHALITYRSSGSIPVIGAGVRFNRVGGASWFGPNASESLTSGTDSSGIANLFPTELYTTSLDTVFGDLIVSLPPPFGTSIRHGYVVRPIYTFNDRPIDFFSVGPSLDYALAFVDSSTLSPLAGVDVQFQRTAGIATNPQSFHAVSDAKGVVRLDLRPLATGTLRGDLTVRPNGAAPVTIVDFAFATFDTDSTLIAARWRVGKTGALYALPPGPP